MSQESYSFNQIGIVHSPYAEKFGVPRQPGLVEGVVSTIELLPPYDRTEALEGLQQFSHVWVVFVFHQTIQEQWKPTVRPPRLGGNERLGVFATRSPFRPNAIGLSCARLLDITCEQDKSLIRLDGLDLVNGTPVLDIKPYIAYTDAHPEAESGYANTAPVLLDVIWRDAARAAAEEVENNNRGFMKSVEKVLAQDPRPAYQSQQADREYGLTLFDINIRWQAKDGRIEIIGIEYQ